MNSPEDSGLRKHFANLRAEDQRAAPPFGRTATTSARFRGSSLFWIALAAMPVLAIGMMLLLRAGRPTDVAPQDRGAWSSPTGFLLETPGRQILSQTPRFGELIYALPAAQDGIK